MSAAERSTRAAPLSFGFAPPERDLQPYVQGLLDIRINEGMDTSRARLHQPPEPALGLVFHYGTPMGIELEGASETATTAQVSLRSHVTGLHEVSHAVQAQGAGGIVTVGFTPLGAACFQGGPMRLFANSRVALEDVFRAGWVREVEEELSHAPTQADRIACVQRKLHRMLVPHRHDELSTWAANRIWAAQGRFRMDTLAQDAGLSGRQLERLFNRDYGVGPKRFARIVRLRHAMALVRSGSMPLAQVAEVAGYSDQPHFVREFKAMMHTTPAAMRRSAITRRQP